MRANDTSLWEIDWRYAYGHEIFRQHLVDFGWSSDNILYTPLLKDEQRYKLILYFCSNELILSQYSYSFEGKSSIRPQGEFNKLLLYSIPQQYIISKYWKKIWRGLVPLCFLPEVFKSILPPTSIKNKKKRYGNFATTRDLHDSPPQIINNNTDGEVKTVLFLESHPLRVASGGLRSRGLFKPPGTPEDPLISIITVVYNNVKLLEQTIQSVINQSGKHIEYIIIDGGSTDGTVELIQHYDQQIDYWVSEPDLGIYDAMNKGLKTILGNLHIMMNCGDLFWSMDILNTITEPGIVKTLYPQFGRNTWVKKEISNMRCRIVIKV